MSNHKGLTKEGVEAAYAEAGSQRGAARLLGVNLSVVQHWLQKDATHDEPSTNPEAEFVEIPVYHRDYSGQDKHYVYPLGDVHIGSPAHAADRWQEWLDFLTEQRRPNSSLLGTGDFFNAALKDSKSEAYDEVLTVGKARKRFTVQMTPLAERDLIDGLADGNHEKRIYRAIGDSPVDAACDALGVQFIEQAAVIVYTVGDQQYELYLRHGTGNAGGQIGSRANQLGRQAMTVQADIYVSGHTHSQLITRDRVFVRDGDRMVPRRRLYVASGSFVQYEGYASERAYVAGEIGAPRIRLDGRKHDVHCSI